jgi:TatD DNase family protein
MNQMRGLPGLIDSHCHLAYEYLPKTYEDLVREAHSAGIEALITIGTDFPSLPVNQEISEKMPNVYHTVGIHPHDTSALSASGLGTLEASAKHPKCKAIGEIGLDYHYTHSSKEVQISGLESQLELARRLHLPVIIHSRDAEEDLLPLLKAHALSSSSKHAPGVIHCFSGTVEFGKKCLDLGFLISFSGIITFKKADEVRAAAQIFPLERILVETDSPFLAPVPFRGKKCEPSMVHWTAQKLAEIKAIPLEEVAEVTTRNARNFFQIPTVQADSC